MRENCERATNQKLLNAVVADVIVAQSNCIWLYFHQLSCAIRFLRDTKGNTKKRINGRPTCISILFSNCL